MQRKKKLFAAANISEEEIWTTNVIAQLDIVILILILVVTLIVISLRWKAE